MRFAQNQERFEGSGSLNRLFCELNSIISIFGRAQAGEVHKIHP